MPFLWIKLNKVLYCFSKRRPPSLNAIKMYASKVAILRGSNAPNLLLILLYNIKGPIVPGKRFYFVFFYTVKVWLVFLKIAYSLMIPYVCVGRGSAWKTQTSKSWEQLRFSVGVVVLCKDYILDGSCS